MVRVFMVKAIVFPDSALVNDEETYAASAKTYVVSERDLQAFELQYRAKANVLQGAKTYWEGILREAYNSEAVAASGT